MMPMPKRLRIVSWTKIKKNIKMQSRQKEETQENKGPTVDIWAICWPKSMSQSAILPTIICFSSYCVCVSSSQNGSKEYVSQSAILLTMICFSSYCVCVSSSQNGTKMGLAFVFGTMSVRHACMERVVSATNGAHQSTWSSSFGTRRLHKCPRIPIKTITAFSSTLSLLEFFFYFIDLVANQRWLADESATPPSPLSTTPNPLPSLAPPLHILT